MRITCVSISHKSATLDLLEQLVLDDEAAERLGRSLLQEPALAEVVVLSTCNRTEVYACGEDASDMQRLILEGLADSSQIEALAPRATVFSDREAIVHLFRVAASLDSMVVGETQVLAQVKRAHRLASTTGSTGIVLNHLFRLAIETGKRVHTETSVGRRPVSLASAAVDLAAQVCGDLKTRTALVLGAGQMSKLAAVHLRARGIGTLFVANRSAAGAQALAERCNAEVAEWPALGDCLASVDIVISATAARHHILDRPSLEQALSGRPERPMVLIDIAVPRDCDPAIAELENARLYDIDDLRDAVDKNQAEREQQAKAGEQIAASAAAEAEVWLVGLQIVPTLRALRDEIEGIREAELARTLRRLSDADAATLDEVTMLSNRLAHKILHVPSVRLRELAGNEDAQVYADMLQRLFGIGEGSDTPAAGA